MDFSFSFFLFADPPISVYKVNGIRGQQSQRNCNSIFHFFILFIDGLLEMLASKEGVHFEVKSELNSSGVGHYFLYRKFFLSRKESCSKYNHLSRKLKNLREQKWELSISYKNLKRTFLSPFFAKIQTKF